MDKITENIINDIDSIIKIQKADGNWNYEPYMHGLLNGMIMIESIIKGIKPKFYEPPKRWKYERWYNRIIYKITRIFKRDYVETI